MRWLPRRLGVGYQGVRMWIIAFWDAGFRAYRFARPQDQGTSALTATWKRQRLTSAAWLRSQRGSRIIG